MTLADKILKVKPEHIKLYIGNSKSRRAQNIPYTYYSSMKIYVKTLTGKTLTLDTCSSDTIEILRPKFKIKKVFLQKNKD